MAIADVSTASIADLISLKGRVAVVIGGAQGLGKAMAKRLAEAGASVLIGDLRLEQTQSTAADIAVATGSRVLATTLDVTDSGSIAAAADLAEQELGGLHIWVNNAGLYPNVAALKMTDELWDQVHPPGRFPATREHAADVHGHARRSRPHSPAGD